MLADVAPSIDGVHETRPRGQRGSSASALGVRPYDEDLDDWLGEISDEDWSEGAAERVERRRATPAYADLPGADPDALAGPAVERSPSRRADPAETRRQVVERRRLVAGLTAVVVVGIALVAAVVLLRGGGDTPATSVTEPTATPTAPSETSPSPTQSTPSESGSTPPAGTHERGIRPRPGRRHVRREDGGGRHGVPAGQRAHRGRRRRARHGLRAEQRPLERLIAGATRGAAGPARLDRAEAICPAIARGDNVA